MSISRRDLLKHLGIASSAAVVPVTADKDAGHAEHMDSQAPAPAAATPREAFETLTAAESDVLEAMADRIIPADENGPGAKAARAAHYIDRALAGPLASFRMTYANGLVALDTYAKLSRRAPFAQLRPEDQDAVLDAVQKGTAPGFAGSSLFFTVVRGHVIEGTFSDPYYGGNANFVGWDLIGYPGVRTSVTAAEQQMGTKIQPNHRSAYDFAMFRKGGTDGR